jgi:hypothetical protein
MVFPSRSINSSTVFLFLVAFTFIFLGALIFLNLYTTNVNAVGLALITTGLVFFLWVCNFITTEKSLKKAEDLMSEIITRLSMIEEKIEELKKTEKK